jgi:voltage-gated potassium channel
MRKTRQNRKNRSARFIRDVLTHTPIANLALLLLVLWMLFAAGLYFSELGAQASSITSYGRALYWGIAAFSTAGIADTPVNGLSQVIGGIWIVVGSLLFFGTIVASRIVETIEYNLEQLDDLTVEELEMLKLTTDTLIQHVEKLKLSQAENTEQDKGIN